MRLKYIGPPGMVNREVGRMAGRGDTLEPNHVYEVTGDAAQELLHSPHWKRAETKKSGTSKKNRRRATTSAAEPTETTTAPAAPAAEPENRPETEG